MRRVSGSAAKVEIVRARRLCDVADRDSACGRHGVRLREGSALPAGKKAATSPAATRRRCVSDFSPAAWMGAGQQAPLIAPSRAGREIRVSRRRSKSGNTHTDMGRHVAGNARPRDTPSAANFAGGHRSPIIQYRPQFVAPGGGAVGRI